MSDRPYAKTTIEKMALMVSAVTEAKSEIVSEFGIGEELNIGVYGWVDDSMVVVTQMDNESMKDDKYKRFRKITNTVCVLRKGWGVDEVTFVAEGYCSVNPDATRGLDLAREYPTHDAIKECLTFIHVSESGHSIITKPYSLTWPRRVVFEDNIYAPGESRLRPQDLSIPLMIEKALLLEPDGEPDDSDSYYETLMEGLVNEGFATKML